MPNQYSENWFKLFLQPIDAAQTAREIAFLQHALPLPAYQNVLDLCCGEGRHTTPLAQLGYQMTALDQSASAIAAARKRYPSATYLQGDMRDLSILPPTFDAALNLWQSFGYFDEPTNANLLSQIRKILKPRGRLILDVYHRTFFANHQTTRTFTKNGQTITESKTMHHSRLFVQLDYGPAAPPDKFDWQLYTPEELCQLAQSAGFSTIHACSNFDAATPAHPSSPRMQLVFEANPA